MKLSSLILCLSRLTVGILGYLLWPVSATIAVVEPLAVYALRLVPIDLHGLWQSIRALAVTVFRTIGVLKPVYRESYATNGHSLGIAGLT